MSEIRRAIERAGELGPGRDDAFERLEGYRARRARRRTIRGLALGGALSLAGVWAILTLLPLSGSSQRPASAPADCSPEAIGFGPRLDPGWGPPGTDVTVTGALSKADAAGVPEPPLKEIQVWWNLDPDRWAVRDSLLAPPSLAPGSKAFVVARGRPTRGAGCFRLTFRVPKVGGGAYPVLVGSLGGGGEIFAPLAFDVLGPGPGGLEHIAREQAVKFAIDQMGRRFAAPPAEARLGWYQEPAVLVWRIVARGICLPLGGPPAPPDEACPRGEATMILDAADGRFITEETMGYVERAPQLPDTIEIPGLTSRGIAIETPANVRLLGFDGRLITELRGFRLNNWTARPGTVVVSRAESYWKLDVEGDRLRHLESQEAADAAFSPDEGADLPPAATYQGQPSGHWRYAIPSPDGSRLLAQWSGECEVPTAFLVDASTRDPKPIAGRTYAEAPESFALGWTPHGEAIVLLPQGACGMTHDEPGVYLFQDAMHGKLLVPIEELAGARVWGG